MKNLHVHEYCLGWHVYTHYPYWAGQCKNEGKGIIYRYSQWRLLNKDQRNVSLFLISSTKTRTAPFKNNGSIALTTGWDVCEVFWKHYFNQRRNWYRATTWEKATRGTTYCRTSSGQQLGDWPRYEKTVPFSASPWSTVMGWTMTWGQDTRRQCHSKGWTATRGEDTRRQCHSKGWMMTRGEDTRRQCHSKGWTMTWGEDTRRQCHSKRWTTTQEEDTRRQCHSDACHLVHREGVDDDLRRGHCIRNRRTPTR